MSLIQGPMRYVTRTPGPALAPFVESIWCCDGELPYARERILPNGTMQLLVNLYEDETRGYYGDGYTELRKQGGAVLCGAHAEHFAIDTDEQRVTLGVNFKPGGAWPFFRAPCSAIRDSHVELGDLWGRDGAVLRDQLCEVKTLERRLEVMEEVLVRRAVRPLREDRAIAFATRAFDDGAQVAAVSDQIGWSKKRFLQRFGDQVGLAPKRYARVRRFQRVLAALEAGKRVEWAAVAAHCGFFDQAHLIHEFRAFSGVSPTAYEPRGDYRNHVALDTLRL